MSELDEQRVASLAAELLKAIRANYLAGPSSRDRVLEALNACAYAAAAVITGTGTRESRRDARRFFDRAVDQNMRAIQDNPPDLH